MSDKKLAMISQPMRGVPTKDMVRVRENAVAELERLGYAAKEEYHIPPFRPVLFNKIALFWLGVSLQNMAECDAVYFCKGWDHARGCLIEHEAAMAYGLEVLYEE
jgi:hypothetical protein